MKQNPGTGRDTGNPLHFKMGELKSLFHKMKWFVQGQGHSVVGNPVINTTTRSTNNSTNDSMNSAINS